MPALIFHLPSKKKFYRTAIKILFNPLISKLLVEGVIVCNNFISNNFITYSSDKCFALVKKELIEIEKRQVVISDPVLKVWLNKELRM